MIRFAIAPHSIHPDRQVVEVHQNDNFIASFSIEEKPGGVVVARIFSKFIPGMYREVAFNSNGEQYSDDDLYVIRLNNDGRATMTKLMRLAECLTVGDVVRNALNVYGLLLTSIAAGGEILLREADGTIARIDILKFEPEPGGK